MPKQLKEVPPLRFEEERKSRSLAALGMTKKKGGGSSKAAARVQRVAHEHADGDE
jgi:hypothetical protein